MKNFYIKESYTHRPEYQYFDDMSNTDNWQREVYEEALNVANDLEYQTIVDVGCGSAFKLKKYFENDFEIIGYDVEPTLSKLNDKYPNNTWVLSDFDTEPKHTNIDLLICSDVIEHVLDPDDLCSYIKKFKAKTIVFSTPDRDLVQNMGCQSSEGPPSNPTHIREWDFTEFKNYISSHFEIEKHWISNFQQATQCIICK